MTVYATVTEFETYAGLAAGSSPPTTPRLLRDASTLIDSVVVVPWVLAPDGSVADADVRDGFKDAVCAQVKWWLATGQEDEALAAFESISIEGLTMKSSGMRVAPRAQDHLALAGLLNRGVGVG